MRPTKRAPDVWDSAAFSSIFLASSFSCSQAESTPAHTQVTQTVSPPLSQRNSLIMLMTSQNYTVDETTTSLRFIFPYRVNDFSTSRTLFGGVFSIVGLVFLVFIVFPIVGEISQSLDNPSLYSFFILFLLLFLLAMVNTFMEVFWRLKGQEIVDISEEGVSIRHQVFNFGITKVFSTEKAPCFFISRHTPSLFIDAISNELRFYNFRRGKIALNYGKTLFGKVNTFRFGSILDKDEAKQVITIIHRRFPRYKCPPKGAG